VHCHRRRLRLRKQERRRSELKVAGVSRTGNQVKVDDVNRNGWRRADLEAALPIDYLGR